MLFFVLFGFFLFLARSFDAIRFPEYFPPFRSLIAFAHEIVFLLKSKVHLNAKNKLFAEFFITHYALFFKQQVPLSSTVMDS